jgi:hypothetical protein
LLDLIFGHTSLLFYFPINSFAIVCNCMFDVPS